MKKTLLIPALIASRFAMASQHTYEISPMIGYDFTEANLNIKNDGYFLGGLEAQYNIAGSKIAPELSVLYSSSVDYKLAGDTDVLRGALNGVYSFDPISSVTPFAKLGAGYEKISKENIDNKSGFIVDAGVGAKIPFTDYLALKVEALYMAKLGTDNSGSVDNNFVTMAGLTFSFGGEEQKAAPIVEEKAPIVEEETIVAVVVPVDGDDDNDGVLNSQDKCPTTLAGVVVDATGCKIDGDDDKDGVLNSKDICPNTPVGEAVNSDGCSATVNLHINFENNSATIAKESQTAIQTYADFLLKYTNYSAKIIGYTDSRGSASYNQKLSEKRANAVMKELLNKGVNPQQVSALGEGENNPVADNATSEGRAANRRIEAELTRN